LTLDRIHDPVFIFNDDGTEFGLNIERIEFIISVPATLNASTQAFLKRAIGISQEY